MSTAQLRRAAALVLAVAALLAVAAVAPAAAFQDKDCADFKTHRQAQHYYKKHGGPRYDPSHLDADHDGRACEDLP
ncbi:MAG TPA: excalibur calcium-binding domain-containing protein [Solirubrobacterales bacterium]|nr:excalibur calcium-binding domain-containing protein [Solirubrobacterales bacterium]